MKWGNTSLNWIAAKDSGAAKNWNLHQQFIFFLKLREEARNRTESLARNLQIETILCYNFKTPGRLT